MCGITGFFDLSRSRTDEQLRSDVTRMAETLWRRGPDDAGVWVDAAAGIALGHRRLSILDLSPAGHQPMASQGGRWQLVYNGEIYNHQELRDDLTALGVRFRGTSDTETLVEAIRIWGVRATLVRCRGIFALAAFDTTRQELILARDHVGVKPLYFGRQGDVWYFGSELKSLRAHSAFRADVDRRILPHYLRHNYIPGPYSIYQGIEKLPAGTWCVIAADGQTTGPQAYWSFQQQAERGVAEPLEGDLPTLVDRAEAELSRVIGEQMLSDVPLGAFLSGGIDSSLVVALMQRQSARPVQTFTIGFDLPHYNEAPYAADVARHLRTDHTECYVTPEQARNVIPLLPEMFDEPFADSSQIPTFLVSQLARKQVTVVLSGDGGDELFCGYRRYFAPLMGLPGGYIPAFLRSTGSWSLSTAAACLPAGRWRKFCQRASVFLRDADPDQRYLRGMSHWSLDSGVVVDPGVLPSTDFLRWREWPAFPSKQQRWMWLDTRNYLPDDILVKVDRCSMAVSLEARVPLLDPRIVELAWRVPHRYKADALSGKRLLKEVLARHVPRPLFERPKMGFGVPIAEWLCGPLRDWGEALLDPTRLSQEGYFHPAPIRAVWEDHLSGRVDQAYLLWDVLMFQSWLDHQRRG